MNELPPNTSGYYQLPAHHDDQLRSFFRTALLGFSLLFLTLALLIWFADRWLVKMPFSWEARFAEPYRDLYEKYRQPSVDNELLEQRLQALADQMAVAMELPADMLIKVFLVDGDDANAFATLGGHIIVNQGLLDLLDNENALAMVLAHEIAHVQNRDPLVGVSRGLLLQLIYSVMTGNNTGLFNTGTEVGMLFFSREQESAADLAALRALQQHYGHVAGATDFFEQMQQRHENEAGDDQLQPEWLSTHPALAERIRLMREVAEANGWQFADTLKLPAWQLEQ